MRIYLAIGWFISTALVCSSNATSETLSVSSNQAIALTFANDDFNRASTAGEALGQSAILKHSKETFLRSQYSFLCGRILVAEGDSWLDYPDGDIVTMLKKRLWSVFSTASRGDTLSSMLYDETQLGDLFYNLVNIAVLSASYADTIGQGYRLDQLRKLANRLDWNHSSPTEQEDNNDQLGQIHKLCSMLYSEQGETPPEQYNGLPKAVIVSAGGNDLVLEALSFVLEHKRSGANSVTKISNSEILNGYLRRLQRMIAMHVSAIERLCHEAFDEPNLDWNQHPCKRIPILLHGYDYVMASGIGYKYIVQLKGPWLKPSFVEKGHENEQLNNAVIKDVIDRYNNAVCNVVEKLMGIETGSSVRMPVFFLDFRREVQSTEWNDEIHPTQRAFERLARKISIVVSDFHGDSIGQSFISDPQSPCIETSQLGK